MAKRSWVKRWTGFSRRQGATLVLLLVLAVVLMPVGARATGTLFTLATGSGFSQQNVTTGAAEVQTFPGVPASVPVNGTVNLSSLNPQRLVAVKGTRIALTDLTVANGGTDEVFVSISTGVASTFKCTGTLTSVRNVYSIAAPSGETVEFSPRQALVLPPFSPTSSPTCVFATATQGSFVFISWVGYSVDPGGIVGT